ncbi:hypothetical protein VNO78_12703 [Psophocarpus tetragonolobus]|uniref:Uncharacterized protein n=1 Tax=Psophocarpus tetragonolobus TaxID=3891 RepID=A0AAN9XPM0_PSOTE
MVWMDIHLLCLNGILGLMAGKGDRGEYRPVPETVNVSQLGKLNSMGNIEAARVFPEVTCQPSLEDIRATSHDDNAFSTVEIHMDHAECCHSAVAPLLENMNMCCNSAAKPVQDADQDAVHIAAPQSYSGITDLALAEPDLCALAEVEFNGLVAMLNVSTSHRENAKVSV